MGRARYLATVITMAGLTYNTSISRVNGLVKKVASKKPRSLHLCILIQSGCILVIYLAYQQKKRLMRNRQAGRHIEKERDKDREVFDGTLHWYY